MTVEAHQTAIRKAVKALNAVLLKAEADDLYMHFRPITDSNSESKLLEIEIIGWDIEEPKKSKPAPSEGSSR